MATIKIKHKTASFVHVQILKYCETVCSVQVNTIPTKVPTDIFTKYHIHHIYHR